LLNSISSRFRDIGSKCTIGVKTTFWGRTTLSATCPFDPPWAISYLWFFGTKPLSLTDSEIFNGECDAMVHLTLNDL